MEFFASFYLRSFAGSNVVGGFTISSKSYDALSDYNPVYLVTPEIHPDVALSTRSKEEILSLVYSISR